MTVTAPPLDLAGAAIDAEIAVVQALVGQAMQNQQVTADNISITADSTLITADMTFLQTNQEVLWQYEQLLNQLQVEAVDHYMVTGWLNAAAILSQYTPPIAWDEPSQALSARVAYLQALVNNPPTPPPGNADGYGGSGWVTVLQNYQQQLYQAQIELVEHMMDVPGGTSAATILAGMTGSQSFSFQYVSGSAVILPTFPALPVLPQPPPPPPPPPLPHNIGGTLAGLAPGNSIVLQLNGANNLTLLGNGSFVFPVQLAAGATYSVTVFTPPTGQPATVVNGSGVVGGTDVGNIQITVGASTLHLIGGTLSGFSGATPVILQNNGGDNLTLISNGPFTFAAPINNGQTYNVTVLSAPASLNVTVLNGSGTVNGADVTNVAVNCAAPATYVIGGTLSGLPAGQTIVLQNNGGDNLTLSANGSFAFATKLLTGATYLVTVLTPPTGDMGTVTNGAGTVGNTNVTNIGVACAPVPTYTVGGTLSGLPNSTSIVLQNNLGDNLTLSANGVFHFATPLAAGATYSVTVLTPPTGYNTTVTNPTGTIGHANVTNIGVSCTALPTYSVGGTMSGLAGGASCVLQNNGGDNLIVNANGAFTFATKLLAGATYAVTVLTQPVDGSTVSITNGTGTMPSANVTNVGANCTGPPHYSVGGTLTGLVTGTFVQLQNNGGDTITLNANGAFTFPTGLLNSATYSVTVLTQPNGGTCTLSNASGTISGANVTNVGASCTATPLYSIGGTLSGLSAGKSIVLQNNGGDNLTLSANGSFAFATKLASAATYVVTVLTPPSGETVVLSNATGTVASSNVTNIGVACAPPTYTIGGTLSGLSAGKSIVLQNNGGDNLTLTANGAFTFATPLVSGAAYAVTVLTAPSGETAAISNGNGTVQSANVTTVSVVCTVITTPKRRFNPGIYVAINYSQRNQGPNPNPQSTDSNIVVNYSAGTAATPLTITTNYNLGTMPGGHLGTGTSNACTKGNGSGGHTLARKPSTGVICTGPAVNIDATHRTMAFVPRYPWGDIETSLGTYDWSIPDADLAQCIALGIQWFPCMVLTTFGTSEASGTLGYPGPSDLSQYATTQSSGTGKVMWRWDLGTVNPAFCAFLKVAAQRYDLCANFGGICTQETSTDGVETLPAWAASTHYTINTSYVINVGNVYLCTQTGISASSGGPTGTGSSITDGSVKWKYMAKAYTQANHLTALQAECDAIGQNSPNSRQLIFQNFIGGAPVTGDPMVDQYAAYAQKYGAILAGPDLVINGGVVYQRCYTSGTGTQAGRYSGYRFGGTIGSGVKFSTTGPTGCSIQRAEWTGINPTQAPQSVANALLYLQGKTGVAGATYPDFLSGQILIIDWAQEIGSPNSQTFIPDGVNLITNNAAPWDSYVPPT